MLLIVFAQEMEREGVALEVVPHLDLLHLMESGERPLDEQELDDGEGAPIRAVAGMLHSVLGAHHLAVEASLRVRRESEAFDQFGGAGVHAARGYPTKTGRRRSLRCAIVPLA